MLSQLTRVLQTVLNVLVLVDWQAPTVSILYHGHLLVRTVLSSGCSIQYRILYCGRLLVLRSLARAADACRFGTVIAVAWTVISERTPKMVLSFNRSYWRKICPVGRLLAVGLYSVTVEQQQVFRPHNYFENQIFEILLLFASTHQYS